jgi:rod shape determining protein RodA
MKNTILKNLDFIVIAATLLLLTAGLLTVYSATYAVGMQSSPYFTKQLTFAGFGIIIMLAAAFIPFRFVIRFAYLFYGISIFLLILVFFIGVRGSGAERWIAVGTFRLQPSELAKLATILAAARYLSRPNTDVNNFRHLAVTIGMILLPFALIIRQPDLGTSLVFLALLFPLLFWAGLNWFILFVMISPAFTAVLSFNFYAFLAWMIIISAVLFISARKPLLLAAVFIFHIGVGLATPAMWDSLRPYQQKRILTFVNPEADPRGAGYQIIQSKVAIGSGSMWGRGYLNGTQTQLKFLPAQHTDFIFSVIGEERGFFGAAFFLKVWAGLRL